MIEFLTGFLTFFAAWYAIGIISYLTGEAIFSDDGITCQSFRSARVYGLFGAVVTFVLLAAAINRLVFWVRLRLLTRGRGRSIK